MLGMSDPDVDALLRHLGEVDQKAAQEAVRQLGVAGEPVFNLGSPLVGEDGSNTTLALQRERALLDLAVTALQRVLGEVTPQLARAERQQLTSLVS